MKDFHKGREILMSFFHVLSAPASSDWFEFLILLSRLTNIVKKNWISFKKTCKYRKFVFNYRMQTMQGPLEAGNITF